MIPIKQEAIDNIIAMQQRSSVPGYANKMAEDIIKENPALFKAIVGSSHSLCNEIIHLTDGQVDANILTMIASNMIMLSLAVYHAIEIQLEANELEAMYGESDAPETNTNS